ncbi:sister chromatid cohesion C-terminus-domain-containing protein [Scheffersomyces amazonensis]|uniref:sister chromatid cohesion C-terminus-domain-containing protein n=1 Tax=Scheffersomyces amazonensis TaxID=1078765 RepID=UPI00315CB1D0
MDGRAPRDLREVLSISPLLHLIPKQDSGALNSSRLTVTSQRLSTTTTTTTTKAQYTIDNHTELMNELASEFTSFVATDPHIISFSDRPTKANENASVVPLPLPLQSTENTIYNSSQFLNTTVPNPIKQYMLNRPVHHSRLSIRKSYEVDDVSKTKVHNETYLRKFYKELGYSGIMRNSNEPDRVIAKRPYIDMDEGAGAGAGAGAESETITFKRKQEPDTVAAAVSVAQVIPINDELTKLMEDDDIDITVNWRLMRIYDLIQQSNEPISIDNLSKIQKYSYSQILTEDISDKLTTIMSIVDGTNSTNSTNSDIPQFNITTSIISQYFYASKIIMTILNGKNSDKSLFLEEYLSACIGFVNDICTNLIIPLALRRDSSIEVCSLIKPFLSSLLINIIDLLSSLCNHIMVYDISEHIITKVEYLCILMLFTDIDRKEKVPLISIQSFDLLKLEVINLITKIFQKYTDQREFLLVEILDNIIVKSTSKSGSKFTLSNGSNITITSLILLKMIHSDQSKVTTDYSQVEAEFAISIGISNLIGSYMISKLGPNSEGKFRMAIQQLIEDVLNVIELPEWSMSTLLLSGIAVTLMNTIQKVEISDTFMLDILGLMIHKISQLKSSSRTVPLIRLDPHSSTNDITIFENQCGTILNYVNHKDIFDKHTLVSFLSKKLINYLIPLYKSDDTKEKESLKRAIDNLIGFPKLMSEVVDAAKTNANHNHEYTNIIVTYDMTLMYDNMLTILVRALEGSRIKAKSRAIRILSTVIETDASVLIIPKVQTAISNRLTDGSASVRDAVIDLITKYMNQKSKYIEEFYIPLCECMNDESVQVRRRVIKLARDMYSIITIKSAKVYIANKLLRRLNDEEESLQELSKSILMEIWFPKYEETFSSSSPILSDKSIENRVEVMTEVVNSSSKNLKYFENFMQVIYGNSNQQAIIKSRLLILVKVLMNDICEGTKKNPQSVLKLLVTLISIDNSLLDQDQLISLQHFIVEEGPQADINRMHTLMIIRKTMGSIKVFRPIFLNNIQTYLLKQLTKFSVRDLHEAMPIIWHLCEVKGDSIKLANASISCMKHIKSIIDSSRQSGSVSISDSGSGSKAPPFNGKLLKLLHLLGHFGRYCQFEKFRSQFMKSSLGLRDRESISSLMMKFLLYFSKSDRDDLTRATAITNITNICCSHPKLYLSEPVLQVLDHEFNVGNPSIVNHIIQGFMEFTKGDDEGDGSTDTYTCLNDINNTNNINNIQLNLNDGVCSGLIQRYLTKILEFCLKDEGKLSHSAIQFLQFVMGQGLANVRSCTPTVIALVASQNPSIKSNAKDMLKDVYEKHESLVQSSVLDGVQKAITYRSQISAEFYNEGDFISTLYCQLTKSVSSKKKFIATICRCLQITTELEEISKLEYQRNKILYMSRNIADIEFSIFEEPVSIINCIDEILIRQGNDLRSLTESVEVISFKMIILSQTLLSLLQLREFLWNRYGITTELLQPNNSSILKQNLKIHSTIKFNLPLPTSTISTDEDPMEQSFIVSSFLQSIANFI